MNLTVIILTLNESEHIARAIRSISSLTDRILVVDSGSTDETIKIARELGANVLVHSFVTQAKQFNWALGQLPSDTEWIFRLDADEIVSSELINSVRSVLPNLGEEVSGATVNRRMTFMGRSIKWGGIFPIQILRLFRYGRGRSEDRWMDEHIIVDGQVIELNGELLDDNLKPLTWWIEKHNSYASREAFEVINNEFKLIPAKETSANVKGPAKLKRLLKERFYYKFPPKLRPLFYFAYRYFFRLGILDGYRGAAFHFLQGFWYRYLVELKVSEVREEIQRGDIPPKEAVKKLLDIDIS